MTPTMKLYSAEELNALPVGTVVTDVDGYGWEAVETCSADSPRAWEKAGKSFQNLYGDVEQASSLEIPVGNIVVMG